MIRPLYADGARVAELLLVLPKYGPMKVDKLLRHCRIASKQDGRDLSERQRTELAALFADSEDADRALRPHERPRSVKESIADSIIYAPALPAR